MGRAGNRLLKRGERLLVVHAGPPHDVHRRRADLGDQGGDARSFRSSRSALASRAASSASRRVVWGERPGSSRYSARAPTARERSATAPESASGAGSPTGPSIASPGPAPPSSTTSRQLPDQHIGGEFRRTAETPELDGVGCSAAEADLPVGFPVWHLAAHRLARHLARGVSDGLFVEALGLPLGFSLLLAPRRPDPLAVRSVLGLQVGP